MAKQVSDGMTLAANRNKFSASAKTGITMHKSFHTVVMTLALLAGCGGGGASSQSATAPADDITSSQPSLLADCGGSSASSQSASASSQSTAVASTFGLSADSNFFTIDTGAGLVFKVRRSNPNNDTSTTSPGDIASMVYNGVQYQDASRGSQVNSGFDNLYKGVTDVVVDAGFVDADHIKITVSAGNLTHYYLAKRGEPRIYMGTYFTSEPDTFNLARFIVRVPIGVLPNGPAPSDIRGNTGAIESSDIFGMLDGETRSKHYSNRRLKDWWYIGATGSHVGLWIVRDNNEGNSGGPFYRSLVNQATATNQEITYIINYGEGQTEAFRPGILNTYTLVFTDGTPPAEVDTSWLAQMGLAGFVAPSARGVAAGSGINGRDPQYKYTVGFSNTTAQYWTEASVNDGRFACSGMIPGTYTMKIYKNELEVDTRSVTVSAGKTAALDAISITGDPSTVTPLWRIGDWDGTPTEFLNGDKITAMHPSDVRMQPWTTPDYVIGQSTPATGFPAYQWKSVNNNITIKFNLSQSQIADMTLRAGITTAYAGGRPTAKVNNWTAPNPAASTQPSTRTLTVGTYRGNNTMYSFNIPASALVAGENTVTLSVISGSSGTGYLSPGVSYDAVDLIATP